MTESTVLDQRVLLIVVPEGIRVYGTSDGRYSWRRSDRCPPMTADDVTRLREERSGDDWSARSARHGGLDQVDPDALARARSLLGSSTRSGPHELAAASAEEMLGGLGLLKRGALTHAGWLMFGRRNPTDAPSIV